MSYKLKQNEADELLESIQVSDRAKKRFLENFSLREAFNPANAAKAFAGGLLKRIDKISGKKSLDEYISNMENALEGMYQIASTRTPNVEGINPDVEQQQCTVLLKKYSDQLKKATGAYKAAKQQYDAMKASVEAKAEKEKENLKEINKQAIDGIYQTVGFNPDNVNIDNYEDGYNKIKELADVSKHPENEGLAEDLNQTVEDIDAVIQFLDSGKLTVGENKYTAESFKGDAAKEITDEYQVTTLKRLFDTFKVEISDNDIGIKIVDSIEAKLGTGEATGEGEEAQDGEQNGETPEGDASEENGEEGESKPDEKAEKDESQDDESDELLEGEELEGGDEAEGETGEDQ